MGPGVKTRPVRCWFEGRGCRQSVMANGVLRGSAYAAGVLGQAPPLALARERVQGDQSRKCYSSDDFLVKSEEAVESPCPALSGAG